MENIPFLPHSVEVKWLYWIYRIIFSASTWLLYFLKLPTVDQGIFLLGMISMDISLWLLSLCLSVLPCSLQQWHSPGCSSGCIQHHTAAGRRGWVRLSDEPVSQRKAPTSHQAVEEKKTNNANKHTINIFCTFTSGQCVPVLALLVQYNSPVLFQHRPIPRFLPSWSHWWKSDLTGW